MGFTDLFKKIFGTKAERDLKQLRPVLDKILAVYPSIDALSDDELRAKSDELKTIIRERIAADEARVAEIREELEKDIPLAEKEALATEQDKLVKKIDETIEDVLNEILPVAFAVMKSTARRFNENESIRVKATDFDRDLCARGKDFVEMDGDTAVWHNHWMAGGNEIKWDMVHYDVQLIGGIVLHQGKIAEMATGEGKTLVATLPVFLNALAGKGVHVVTVNDYLSKRDSEWMGPLYQFHGLSVDCIDKHQPNSDARKKAYSCNITFGTNNEFGFDYLRDNMAVSQNDLVQRKHHFAIVDEVDSVLIDDARTPLIISGPVPKGEDQQFLEYKPFVERLYNSQRSLVTNTLAEAKRLIAAGNEKDGGVLLLRAYKGLPKYKPLIKYLSEPGIKTILQKTENYYIQDNEREMPFITDPLYFVINEKQHSVDMTDLGHDLLSKSLDDPKFFVLPDVGSQVADVEKSELSKEEKQQRKDEIMAEFAVKSERVHTVIQLLKAYAMFEKDIDYIIVDNKVKIVDEQTGRVMEGRRWSDGLHQAVEAKEMVKVEAATQTMATITLQNYFRMYHKLSGMTGTAETEAGEFWEIYKLDVVVIPTNRPIARKDEDDLIYKTKKAKYEAVINRVSELISQGRPVLVGTADVETSELLSRMLRMRGIEHQVLNAKQHAREAEVVAHAGKAGTVTIATNMAGRGTDIKLPEEVKAAGGLAIIGTERHDSRRVDRQLRGRAGRQGDPGSSTFYVSLEDKLMRLFGSERIAGVVDKLGMEENEALESPMLSKNIERAQKKVEENNFGIRKRLLEYDDVMNSQREVVYTKRRNALSGERVEIDVMNMMQDMAELMGENAADYRYEDFRDYVLTSLSIDPGFDEEFFQSATPKQISEKLFEAMLESYHRRMDTMVQRVFPVIKQVYETQSALYQNIAIPISDGRKMFTLSTNLKKAYESNGRELVRDLNKTVTLISIDELWKEHLRDMDDLKQSVQNAHYEQKDPLLIYKFESFNLFKEMLEKMNRNILSFLFRAQIPLRDASEAQAPAREKKTDMSRMQTSRNDLVTNGGQPKSNAPVHVEKTVGRNDPCPCGSGKKFKNCHGKDIK